LAGGGWPGNRATFEAVDESAAVGGGEGAAPPPRLRPDRTATAAVAELTAATSRLRAAESAAAQSGWWRRRRAEEALAAAKERHWAARRAISLWHVGATPDQWGLLSDSIESTLDPRRWPDNGDLHVRFNDIRANLLQARLDAHEGDRALEFRLTRDLARCLELEMSDEYARRIVHHLPGWARPIPGVDISAVADELASRRRPPFDRRYFHYFEPELTVRSFIVCFDTLDELTLHDIAWTSRPQSPGPGSAALEHLCRSADHYGLRITGAIMPGDQKEATASRLAHWYGRHGFEVIQVTPGEYLRAKISRSSRPAR
jgi:hypothetical protein